MKKIDLGQTIAILANIGVIAGIVFLAVETRQNNRLLAMESNLARTEAYIGRTAAAVTEMHQLALSADLADLLTRVDADGLGSLSESERLRVLAWQLARMYGVSAEWYRYEQGYLSQEAIDNVLQFGALPNVEIWRELGIDLDNDSLVEALRRFAEEASQ